MCAAFNFFLVCTPSGIFEISFRWFMVLWPWHTVQQKECKMAKNSNKLQHPFALTHYLWHHEGNDSFTCPNFLWKPFLINYCNNFLQNWNAFLITYHDQLSRCGTLTANGLKSSFYTCIFIQATNKVHSQVLTNIRPRIFGQSCEWMFVIDDKLFPWLGQDSNPQPQDHP